MGEVVGRRRAKQVKLESSFGERVAAPGGIAAANRPFVVVSRQRLLLSALRGPGCLWARRWHEALALHTHTRLLPFPLIRHIVHLFLPLTSPGRIRII